MNFTKIFKLQETLDSKINKTIDIKNIEKLRVLALFVEVGELANEIASFKYWKKNKDFSKSKILEEYADGLHFLSIFANKYKINPEIKPLVMGDLNQQFLEIISKINTLKKKVTKKTVVKLFELYLGIAKLLNYTEQEIEDAYENKNKINHKRIQDNY